MNKKLKDICQQVLNIRHTDVRGRDQLDFHDLHITNIKEALQAAYEAGRQAEVDQWKATKEQDLADMRKRCESWSREDQEAYADSFARRPGGHN